MEVDLDDKLRSFLREDPSAGYRTLHARLKEQPGFESIGLKKVQTALGLLRQEQAAAVPLPPEAETARAGPGENVWTAASDGDIPRVEELMALDGFTPTSADENGYTPVHAAASWARVELLQLLLNRDAAAVNVKDSDGDTPLHHVANASELEESQVKEVVGLLLAHRADPTLVNGENQTCLEVCGASLMQDEEEMGEEVEVNLTFVKVLAEHGFKLEDGGR
mmetsp:Transcript_73194/g.214550  ORF Transcript_73194/g.214550 Transcript_73194/m.214550 type:complete len:222 (-) Transcript_73194:84-749(-)